MKINVNKIVDVDLFVLLNVVWNWMLSIWM